METTDNIEIYDENGTNPIVSSEIFSDEVGKVVFDAFEKLGNELNTLTENLEAQFEDVKETESDGPTYESIDVGGIIAASREETCMNDGVSSKDHLAVSEGDADEDLVDLLNRSTVDFDAESSPRLSSKRNSVGSSYMDADSIASGGDSASLSPKKISELINNLHIRSLSQDESSSMGGESAGAGGAVVDEWVNDEDTGYTIITLSEEEFFDYEEETSARILAERKEQAANPQKKIASPKRDTNSNKNNSNKKVGKSSAALPKEPALYEDYASDTSDPVLDLSKAAQSFTAAAPVESPLEVVEVQIEILSESATPIDRAEGNLNSSTCTSSSNTEGVGPTPITAASPGSKEAAPITSTGEREAATTIKEVVSCPSPPPPETTESTAAAMEGPAASSTDTGASGSAATGIAAVEAPSADALTADVSAAAVPTTSPVLTYAQVAAQLVEGGAFGASSRSASRSGSRNRDREEAQQNPVTPDTPYSVESTEEGSPVPAPSTNRPFDASAQAQPQQSSNKRPENRRQSVGERRRNEIMGQKKFVGVDGVHCYFNLKVIFEPYKTGFEENKDLQHPKGTIIAGRYEVHDVLGTAAFSTALQCVDLAAEEDESQWVCLKVIKNNKDFFDQSMDEIKLLQYINSCGDPDENHVLRLIDFFYCREHLFIVSELLKENLYEFGRFIRESNNEPYYTMPRLKRITKQVLEALVFIHGLKLIHCDIKPENIVIKSFSRCEVKLIDFGSSCFTSDHLTTYIQSRSYRAPEVIIGHPYDTGIDIWSVGAVLAELHTGYVLFQNDSVATMLSRITGILGQFPQHVLQRGKDTGKYFSLSNIVYERDEEGSFHLIFPKRTDLPSRLHLPEDPAATALSADEEQFVDFVRQMLHLDPAQRMTAEEALAHPWLSDADTVYVSEYIIGQGVDQGAMPPPPPNSRFDNGDDDDEEGSGEDESGESGDADESEEYEYDEDDLEAAEAEEAALQYLLNSQGGTAEAMEAYLRHLQMQQDGEFEDSDDNEYEECGDGEEGEGGEGDGDEEGVYEELASEA